MAGIITRVQASVPISSLSTMERGSNVMDSVQDEINTLLMDEGESAFIEGVTFGVRLMLEVGGG